MTEFDEIIEQLDQVDNIVRERDMAKAYIDITKQYGPSKQLLLFVNYDNSLEQHVGIGLESMDLLDQHEFLLSKLDPDQLDQIATEGLGKILKYVAGGWLVLNGVTLIPAAAMFGPFGVGAAAIGAAMATAGTLLIKSGMNESSVPTVKYFTQLTAQFNSDLREIDLFSASMPSNLDEKAWTAFVEKMSNDGGTSSAQVEKAAFKSSGWDANKVANALGWLKANANKIQEADKKVGAKFKSLENQLEADKSKSSKVSKFVSQATKAYTVHIRESVSTFHDISHVVETVSKHFEKKKDD